jgi:class 3 adenylate cyclase
MGTDWTLWVMGGAAAAWLGGFGWVLLRRRCARLRNGLTLEITAAVVTAGVVTALSLGAWAYHQSQKIIFAELVDGLENVAHTAEVQLEGTVRTNQAKLSNLATTDLLETARRNPEKAREQLALIMRFNPRFLQVCAFDAQGGMILSTTRDAGATADPVNRIGVAYAVEGKPYVSQPYKAAAFGRYVLFMCVPVLDASKRPVGALSLRYDFQDAMNDLLSPIRFGETGHAVLLDDAGTALTPGDDEKIGDDLSHDPFVADALQGRSGAAVFDNENGVPCLYVYRPVASPATVEGKELAIITEISLDEALAPMRTLHNGILVGTGVLALLWLALARPVARHLTRPLAGLLDAAQKVRDGDLTTQAPVGGRDEIARFAEAFNQMVQGLQERDRVKQIFGRYVTTQVSEKLLKNGGATLGAGELKQVTMLFADIRDFTTLSESMTPEQVVDLLNDYFSEMVDAVFEHGGVLDKFIGDGMLAVFGSLDEQTDHRRRAVLAGLRMKARLAKINGEREMRGEKPIHIGIGIHTDEVVVGNIGSRKRLEYTVIGDGVNTCARVESMNKELGTTLLITEQTHEPIGGEFECRAMPETKVKGKSKPIKVYEVLSARASTPRPMSPRAAA